MEPGGWASSFGPPQAPGKVPLATGRDHVGSDQLGLVQAVPTRSQKNTRDRVEIPAAGGGPGTKAFEEDWNGFFFPPPPARDKLCEPGEYQTCRSFQRRLS